MKQYPDLRPRALSGTRTGCQRIRSRPDSRPPFAPTRRWAIVAWPMSTRPSRSARAVLFCASTGACGQRFGHAGWWPGESPFEVCVGAILVQNTAWANVERTLASLRRRGPPLVRGAPPPPAVAARAPPAVLGDVPREGAAAAGLPRLPRRGVRRAGRGDEGGRARQPCAGSSWRCRASARRPPTRSPSTPPGNPSSSWTPTPGASSRASGSCAATCSYAEVQQLLRGAPPPGRGLYNDYHAQLVRLGKEACRPRPRCAECPLDDLCPKRGAGLVVTSSTRSSESLVILRSSGRLSS